MSTIEAALRGGAVALLALLAVTALSDWRRSPAARYGALLAASAAAYAIQSAPDAALQHSLWVIPPRLVSSPRVDLAYATVAVAAARTVGDSEVGVITPPIGTCRAPSPALARNFAVAQSFLSATIS